MENGNRDNLDTEENSKSDNSRKNETKENKQTNKNPNTETKPERLHSIYLPGKDVLGVSQPQH